METGHMRLASFKANGRISYGAVTDGGIVDECQKLDAFARAHPLKQPGAPTAT